MYEKHEKKQKPDKETVEGATMVVTWNSVLSFCNEETTMAADQGKISIFWSNCASFNFHISTSHTLVSKTTHE